MMKPRPVPGKGDIERALGHLKNPKAPEDVKAAAREVLALAGVDVPESKVTDPWNLMTTAQIFAPLPPYPWLIAGLHIAPGRITLLNGYANAGKTIIAMTIALGVATGRPIWGLFAPARVGKVLHMNGEIGTYIARERYQRLARGAGVKLDELVASGNLILANYPRAFLDDPGFEQQLAERCKGFALVIIDSLRAFSGALDENAKEIGIALLMLARVSEMTGTTIIVLHHNRKTSKDDVGGAKMAISGSSSILGGSECAFVMAANEKGAPIIVQHERSPIGTPMADFGLSFEDMPKGDDPRWGLRVAHLDAEQIAEREAALGEARERVALDKTGTAIVETVKRFAGQFRGSRDAFRAACGVGKGPFLRALAALIDAGVVEQGGSYHQPEWHFTEEIAASRSGLSPDPVRISPPSPEYPDSPPRGSRDDDDQRSGPDRESEPSTVEEQADPFGFFDRKEES